MPFTQNIEHIIQQRTSVRTYSKNPIEPHKERALKEFLASHPTGPFESTMRFQLITADPDNANALKGLGTYGMIKHPAGFIVGAVDESSPKSLEDFGYAMEYIILAATDLGLGTCWLGGSFRQSNFAKAMQAGEHENIPAVVSIGECADKKRLLDILVRKGAGSDKRLPWEQLFFFGNFETTLSQDAAASYAAVLEMVRLAPSASNKQPWRIVKEPGKNRFHLYLQRTPGYNRSEKKTFRMADLQRADMGIAMCHFGVTAQEHGLNGRWEDRDPKISPLPERTEYVTSWIVEA